jgi:hypothetical protein
MIYAAACHLTKSDGWTHTCATSLHLVPAGSEDEARGIAVERAMKMNPDFAVTTVLVTPCEKEPEA